MLRPERGEGIYFVGLGLGLAARMQFCRDRLYCFNWTAVITLEMTKGGERKGRGSMLQLSDWR